MAAKKRRRALWISLTLLVLASAAFFSLKAIGSKPAKIDPEKIAKVERMDIARSVVATGKVQPVTQVDIKSKASGIIQKLPVNVGDPVHKGEVLLRIGSERSHARAQPAAGGAACRRSRSSHRTGRLRTL